MAQSNSCKYTIKHLYSKLTLQCTNELPENSFITEVNLNLLGLKKQIEIGFQLGHPQNNDKASILAPTSLTPPQELSFTWQPANHTREYCKRSLSLRH